MNEFDWVRDRQSGTVKNENPRTTRPHCSKPSWITKRS
jgi:hypothetical protein